MIAIASTRPCHHLFDTVVLEKISCVRNPQICGRSAGRADFGVGAEEHQLVNRAAICFESLCGFSSGGMDDSNHTFSARQPSNSRCPAPFFTCSSPRAHCRPRASHAHADRCVHCPGPSG